MQAAILIAVLAIACLVASVYMHVKDKDGSGWGFMAFCLFVTSCSQVS